MAANTSTSAASASTSSSSDDASAAMMTMFVDDDEETLSLLVSPPPPTPSAGAADRDGGLASRDVDAMATRLRNLARRFLDDHVSRDSAGSAAAGNDQQGINTSNSNNNNGNDSNNWMSLVHAAHELGFSVSFGPISQASVRALASPAPAPSSPLPRSFDTDDGRLHLEAASAMLDLSKHEAAQLTLSTLRSVPGSPRDTAGSGAGADPTDKGNQDGSSKSSRFASLLGTKALLEKVMDHHFRQRVARLSVIAEMLRSELDNASPWLKASVPVLDSLDQASKQQEGSKGNRGLFRVLLTAACQPDVPYTREQLSPAKKLRDYVPVSLQERMTRPAGENAWKHFVASAMEKRRSNAQRERLEALEALLALLYTRIEGGVERSDLVLILLAFQSSNAFFTGFPKGAERLPRLAGLICAECMGLWRVSEEIPDDESWVSNHPLLLGVAENRSSAEQEINAIVSLLSKYANQVMYRRVTKPPVEAPEGLALLSFGLLLCVAHSSLLASPMGATLDAFWHLFGSTGMEISSLANDQCEAFDYLFNVMKSLVVTPKYDEPDYVRNDRLALSEQDGPPAEADLSAPCLLYASIGRELLSLVVTAFGDAVLQVDHSAAPENIGMLCGLASVIFRNSPTLSSQFWSEWDLYTSPDPSSSSLVAVPKLVDSAYSLAFSFIEAKPPKTSDEILRGITPLLQIVATVVYNADVTETAISVLLPEGLISSVLQMMSSARNTEKERNLVLLDSISTLVKMGKSSACRKFLREALDCSKGISSVGGPRTLLTILVNQRDLGLQSSVFTILALLIDDAPVQWALEVASSLQWAKRVDHQLFSYDNATAAESFVLLVGKLVHRIGHILYCESFEPEVKAAFLSLLESCLQSCCSVVTTSVSTLSSTGPGVSEAPYGIARALLSCVADALKVVRPIIQVHEDQLVRVASGNLQASIINTLAVNRGLGDALFHYATAPVSLSLLCSLDDYLTDKDVFQLMLSKDRGNHSSLLSQFRGNTNLFVGVQDKVAFADKFFAEELSSDGALQVDFDRLQEKRWIHTDDVPAVLPTSLAALRLLNIWARSVEDMVVNDGTSMLVLSPYQLLASGSLMPAVSHLISTGVSNFSLLVPLMKKGGLNGPADPLAALTLDFLFICITHANASSDTEAFGECWESEQFRGAIESQLSPIKDLAQKNAAEADTEGLSLTLHALRLFQACLDANPSSGLGIFGSDPSAVITQMVDAVNFTTKEIIQDPNTAVIDHLKLAAGCLAVLVPIWQYGRSEEKSCEILDKITTIIQGQSGLLSHLSCLVFSMSNKKEIQGSSQVVIEKKRLLTCITFLSMHLLAIELAWAQESGKQDLPIMSAVENGTEQQLSSFICCVRPYLTINSCFSFYTQAHNEPGLKPMKQATASLDLQLLHKLSSTSTQIARDIFTESSGFELIHADSFLSSFEGNGNSLQDLRTSLQKLASSRCLLQSELQQCVTWAFLAESLSLVLGKLRDQSLSHPLLAIPSGTFATSVVQEICEALHESMASVEQTQLKSSPALLVNQSLKVAQAAAGLLVHFTAYLSMSMKEWSKTIWLVGRCSKKLVSVLGFDPATSYPLQQLLACSAKILCLKPERLLQESKSWDCLLDLASTSVELLSACDEAFPSCVALLTALMGIVSQEMPPREEKLRSIFQSGVVGDLARRAGAGDQASEFRIVQSILTLFTSMVVADSSFLPLLVEDGASSLMERCAVLFPGSPAPASLERGKLPLRGYLLKESQGLGVPSSRVRVGIEDPAHLVWRACMKFLATCLRASSSHSSSFGVNDSTQAHLLSLALHFIKAHGDKLLLCLHQCCSRPSAEDQSPPFTLNALNEASCILSVASELCSRECRDQFIRECPAFFDELLQCSKSLLVNISSFLGASASSRELFQAMDEFEKADTMPIEEYQLAVLSPAYHLLTSSGVPNAKHEAIRYSHFVSRFSASITEKERIATSQFSSRWKREDAGQTSDPRSLSMLESKCRSSVTSDFAFEMEKVAAEGLYFALLCLWRTHPSSSSFVTFSQEEAKELDAFSLVRPGTVIAFRGQCRNSLSWLTVAGERGDARAPRQPVEFARVLHSDTVHQQWQVRIIEGAGAGTERVVSKDELAGIEDTTKRSCVLSYFPAPETSSHLEASLGSASIGHLMLALRWCQQIESEMKSWKPCLQSGFDRAITGRLAELASALIGTELSLYRETRPKQQGAEKLALREVFATQIFDLFGSEDPPGTSGGRMKEILSPAVLSGVRNQCGGV